MALNNYILNGPSTVILDDQRDPRVSWQNHLARTGRGGVDLVAVVGTPVLAPTAGWVRRRPNNGSAGNSMWFEHRDNSGWGDVFSHLSSYVGGDGQFFEQGQVIAYSGNTGGVVQHLHRHLEKGGARYQPWDYFSSSSAADYAYGLSSDAQGAIQLGMKTLKLYDGVVDKVLGPNSVKAFQQHLKDTGYLAADYEVDGIPGPKYGTAVQEYARDKGGYTGQIDGAPGPLTSTGIITAMSKIVSPIPSADWAKWQAFLAKYWGYDGIVDGVPGVVTFTALQKFLAAKFGYDGIVDGDPGPLTWAAFAKAQAAGYPKDDATTPPTPPKIVVPTVPAGTVFLVDIGSSQSAFDFELFKQAGGRRVIVKMGGGNAGDAPYRAPHYDTQITKARAAQVLVGHYWFNGAKNGLTPESSAEYFHAHADIRTGEIVALDVEAETTTGTVAYTADEAHRFAKRLRELRPGIRVGIYANNSVFAVGDWNWIEAEQHWRWRADWDANDGKQGSPPANPWAVWQYSSQVPVPGISSLVDGNVSIENLFVNYGYAVVVTPPEKPELQATLGEYFAAQAVLATQLAAKLT